MQLIFVNGQRKKLVLCIIVDIRTEETVHYSRTNQRPNDDLISKKREEKGKKERKKESVILD